MKNFIIALITVTGAQALAYEGTHPGLPPSSQTPSQYSNENTVYTDIYSRGTNTINTKYGTAMTADEIKEATENRRAQRDRTLEGGPSSGAPIQESPTY